jgi:hypothetical protein
MKLQLWGGCNNDVLSLPGSLEMCVDGGILEHQELVVSHTSLRFNQSRGRPIYRYSCLGD